MEMLSGNSKENPRTTLWEAKMHGKEFLVFLIIFDYQLRKLFVKEESQLVFLAGGLEAEKREKVSDTTR